MEQVRLRLGELLVEARIITQEQLEQVLDAQKRDGRRLGTLLVERGLINETQLTQILSQQLSVPWVSLYHVDFSRRLLALVPRDVAASFCLIPIYVRHVRGQGDTLYVAMDDPTNVEALNACAKWSGLPTRAMIAAPSDIRSAIDVYYGPTERAATQPEPAPATATDTQAATEQPNEPVPAPAPDQAQPPEAPPQPPIEPTTPPTAEAATEQPAPATADELPAAPTEAAPPEATSAPSEEAPGTAAQAEPEPSVPPSGAASLDAGTLGTAPPATAEEVSIEVGQELSVEELLARKRARQPKAEPGSRVKLMSLTLLDGTTISVPVRKGRAASQAPEQPPLGARPEAEAITQGAIEHLRAAASERGAEALVVALVVALARRGLVQIEDVLESLDRSP